MSEALLTIHQKERAILVNQSCRGIRDQVPGLDPRDIGGDHADTVAVMPGQICTDQSRGNFLRCIRVSAGMTQDCVCQRSQLLGVDLHMFTTFLDNPISASSPEVMGFGCLVNRFDKLNSICWSGVIGSGEEERPGLMDTPAPTEVSRPGHFNTLTGRN